MYIFIYMYIICRLRLMYEHVCVCLILHWMKENYLRMHAMLACMHGKNEIHAFTSD